MPCPALSFHPLILYGSPSDVPIESLRLRFALLQSLNTTLETFFLPLVELRQTKMYTNSIAALLQEAKGQTLGDCESSLRVSGLAQTSMGLWGAGESTAFWQGLAGFTSASETSCTA